VTLKSDWRLMGQEKYLNKVDLMYAIYNESNTKHDHCEFCFAKFSSDSEDLHEGYCTLDKYRWICEDCYNDFKEMFQWKVIN